MGNNNEDVSRHDEITPSYSLTVEEAAKLFEEAGVPKSPRTISRNCEDGTILCIREDTLNNWRYMVSKASVERRIAELKNITKIPVRHDTSSYDQTQQVTSRHDESHHDATSHNETRQDASRHNETSEQDEKIRNLEAEVRGLSIDKAVRDRSIQYLEKQLTEKNVREEKLIDQLVTQSRLIGNLEKELLLLGTGIGQNPPARDTSFLEKPSSVVTSVEGIQPEAARVENLQSENPGQSVQ